MAESEFPDSGDDGSAHILLEEEILVEEEVNWPVYPDSWPAIDMFILLLPHWRVLISTTERRHQGLDYPAMWALFKIFETKDTADMFNQLKYIEMGALEVLNGN